MACVRNDSNFSIQHIIIYAVNANVRTAFKQVDHNILYTKPQLLKWASIFTITLCHCINVNCHRLLYNLWQIVKSGNIVFSDESTVLMLIWQDTCTILVYSYVGDQNIRTKHITSDFNKINTKCVCMHVITLCYSYVMTFESIIKAHIVVNVACVLNQSNMKANSGCVQTLQFHLKFKFNLLFFFSVL
jgi:hypothetical protein